MSLSIAAPAVVQSEDRRGRALSMRINGATYSEIGKALSITTEGARKLVVRGLEAKRAGNEKLTAVLRATDNARLETAVKGLMPAVEKGCPKSVMALVSVLNRRARLMGLDLTKDSLPPAAQAYPAIQAMTDSELRIYAERAGLVIRSSVAASGQGATNA